MKRVLLFLLIAAHAFAGTITGSIQTAAGGVVGNGTLTFALSQPAVISGTASLVTSSVSCYTSTAGNVVGVPDPLVLPVLSVNLVSGTLPSGTYYVKFIYNGAGGASVASPEQTAVLSGSGTLIMNGPASPPGSATGYSVYISTSSGTETLQGSVVGFGQYSQSVALVPGTALPVSNTSVCTLTFSDQMIPTGTYYSVSLANKNGSAIAGYPQTWCTYGGAAGTINVSQGAPTGSCNVNGVFYPTPIFSSPQNGASQSINGPLTVTGNATLQGLTNTACTINGVLYVGQGTPFTTCWGSSDIGAQINAAYAAGAATGVHIHIAPGDYSYTTPILLKASQKPVFLECAPGVDNINTSNPSTTQLNYTPTTGTALTIDTSAGSRFTGCTLQGAGSGNSTVGLQWSTTSSFNGAIDTGASQVDVAGFGTGLQFGSNVYIAMFRENYIHDNGTNVSFPAGLSSTGENITFLGGAVGNKGAAFSTSCVNILNGGMHLSFQAISLDQCGVTLNAVNLQVDFTSVHMENPNGATTNDFITIGALSNALRFNWTAGWINEDSASGGGRTEFILVASTVANTVITVNINGGTFAPAETVAQMINSTTTCCVGLTINGAQFGNGASGFTNNSGGTYSATFLNNAGSGGGGNLSVSGFLQGLSGVFLGTKGVFTEGGTPAASSGLDVCYGDSTAHAVKCSYNNGSFFNTPLVGLSNTWTAAQVLGTGGSINASAGLLISSAAPTISSGFGTSPSIANNNGTAVFTINVGTGGTASTGIIGLPTAPHGWFCTCADVTTSSSTVFACKQTGVGSTTTAPIGEFTAAGAGQAWTASDIVTASCYAY